MERHNLNVVIFDDDQQLISKEDIKKYTSTSKGAKLSPVNGHSSGKNFKKNNSNDKGSIISKQISVIQQKLKGLQREGEKIKLEVQKRNGSNKGNIGASGSNPKCSKQIEQILLIVEKKIQLIIQESKKLINKMTETFDKKLSSIKQQNNTKLNVEFTNDKNKNKLNQIQLSLRHRIEEYEIFYRNQYEKFVKESKKKEQIMMKKVSEMELKFSNKINTFQTKEKEYVDWIHHLQAKLKQRRSKKMITITQQKPQLSPMPSKNSIHPNQNNHNNNLENIPSSNFHNSKVNCSIDQNNSKITRKHKIFGGKSNSPTPRNDSIISPTKDMIIPQQGPNKIHNHPTGSSFYQQNQRGGQNLNFYSELRKQEYGNMRQNSQRQGGWDKFADMNEFNQQYTQSESDDFFAPIDPQEANGNYEKVLANIPLDSRGGTYYREPTQLGYQNQYEYQENRDKVFSPFDLN